MSSDFATFESIGKFLAVLLAIYLAGRVARALRGRFGRQGAEEDATRRENLQRKARVENPDPRYALDVAAATLVHETTTSTSNAAGDRYATYHRILRNPHGTYFLHIYSPAAGTSYDNMLTREEAMNALRGDPEAFRREFGDPA